MYKLLTKLKIVLALLLTLISQSCGIYTLSGASTVGLETVSIQFFENTSSLVVPYLSQEFTEELKTRIRTQSSLSVIRADAHANFEGRITDYSVRPVAIQGNERAGLNRITVTVMVKYTNLVNAELSFEESFTAFQEFSLTAGPLQTQEPRLITLINKQLSELIFNRAFASW